MHFVAATIVIIATQLLTANSARILAIFAFPAPSQYAFVEPLLQKLAERGHHITSITNFPQKVPRENFRDIVISENLHLFDDFKNFTIDNVNGNYYDVVDDIYNKAFEMCENILGNSRINKLRENEKFDLIMVNLFFSESFFGFSQHFKAPIVGISDTGIMSTIDDSVGNILPLSYISNLMITRQYGQNMNFWHRCLNVLLYVLEWFHYYYKYLPVQKRIYEHYFPKASITFEEAQKNLSVVLLNDHFTLSTARPYVPNMIDVAGMHILAYTEPLPEHINNILNNAGNGVIYVTMDSPMPEHVRQMILNQFENLQQTVLWCTKYTPSSTLKVPTNIYFTSNLDEYAVLLHSNIHLLISHGNYLSVINSIHYGIPILGIPNMDGASDDYVDSIKKIGNGLSLKHNQLNAKSLSRVLNELLATDHYRRQAKLRSQQFRDQQNPPLEKAVYWIEYVLRHKGASHLRNLGQNLRVWEFYNLDVILCLSFVVCFFICLSYIFLKLVTIFLVRCFATKYKND